MRVAKVLDAAQPGEELEKPLSRHLVLQGELPGQIANPRPYLHAIFPDVEAEDLPLLHGEIHILYAPRFAAVGLGKLRGLYRQAHQFLLSYRSNTAGK